MPGTNLKKFAVGRARLTPRATAPSPSTCWLRSRHLHAHGLVHRDVTPTNVIVTPEGRAKLIDFGVASAPTATTVVGTPAFMAPELRAGRGADPRSDLYEFGVTMIYTMLGRYPYAGDPDRGDDDRALVHPADRRRARCLGAARRRDARRAVHAAWRPTPRSGPASADEVADELRLVDEIPEIAGQRRGQPGGGQPARASTGRAASATAAIVGLDDEFARQTYVPTLLDTELLPAIVAGEKRLVLLTGNPGDGKTSFLVKVGERLRARGAQVATRTRPAGGCASTAIHSWPSTTPASRTRGSRPTT